MIIKTMHDYENLYRQYVFRGQSNKDWCLLPSAYRDGSTITMPAIEKNSVDQFIQHLQENGYCTFPPELSRFDFLTKSAKVFPAEEVLPYWALAQHYASDSHLSCVKTSLLDVTHNLDIAAYFAVEKETEKTADGKIFVFDPSAIKEPYKLYEPPGGSLIEARLVVQAGAFIYREQICEYEAEEKSPYKNKKPFDDIVKDRIIIPSDLKPILKEFLQKKLCDLLISPRLIMGRVTPNLATAGRHSFEELQQLNTPVVTRAERLGDKHSDY
jgi:hypothetical protein